MNATNKAKISNKTKGKITQTPLKAQTAPIIRETTPRKMNENPN